MKKRYWIGGGVAVLVVIGSLAGGGDGSDDTASTKPKTVAASTATPAPASETATPTGETATPTSETATPSAESSTTAPAEPVSYSHDDVVKRMRKLGYPTLQNDGDLNESIGDSCSTINNRPLTGPVAQQDRQAWLTSLVGGDTSRADANTFVDRLFQACRDTGNSAVWVAPLTVSQEQAVGSAQDYLSFQAFSRQGLIDQLSSDFGEGYSVADATFAVDHIEVDWNQQAVKSAKNYLTFQHFSRDGLIGQLESAYGEQFTHDQAVFGVNHTGL